MTGLRARLIGRQVLPDALDHLWIDKDEAAHMLECLVNYQYAYDETGRAYKSVPKHAWTSHGVDQIRMFAVGYDAAKRLDQPLLFNDTFSTGRGRRYAEG